MIKKCAIHLSYCFSCATIAAVVVRLRQMFDISHFPIQPATRHTADAPASSLLHNREMTDEFAALCAHVIS